MNTNPDVLIDQVLAGLRDTEAPRGLESRIAARVAARQSQAADARANAASPFAIVTDAVRNPRTLFAGARLYATAATILLSVALIALHLHHKPQTVAHTHPLPASPNSLAESNLRAGIASFRAGGPPYTSVERSPTYASGMARSIVSPDSIGTPASTPAADDPDTLALAETLAPSRPAPPMPLTPQEQLLVAATRQGQPIELAELETLRQPTLHSLADARERSTIRRYVESLLGPLAAAEAINPTPASPNPDYGPIASASEPPSSK